MIGPLDSDTKHVTQERETPVQLVKGKYFAYRYVYARSADTRSANDAGQDYVTFREEGGTFVFALCDGVSQSFYGDIAARILGDGLLAWLLQELPDAGDPQGVRQSLGGKLSALTMQGTEAVRSYALPGSIPPMLAQVLEQKRARGSESTFVCGRLDLPDAGCPQGRALFAWMGDSRLRVWDHTREITADLGGTFATEQRWSTSRGVVGGEPSLYVAPLYEDGLYTIRRVLAYSDGLSALDRWSGTVSNAALQELVEQTGEAATSDDVSLIEVWPGAAPGGIEAAQLPAPRRVVVSRSGDALVATWMPVQGASGYEIEVRNGQRESWGTRANEWVLPPLPGGSYRLRVRAWDEESANPGQWSAPQQVETADAPAPSAELTSAPAAQEPDAPRPQAYAGSPSSRTGPYPGRGPEDRARQPVSESSGDRQYSQTQPNLHVGADVAVDTPAAEARGLRTLLIAGGTLVLLVVAVATSLVLLLAGSGTSSGALAGANGTATARSLAVATGQVAGAPTLSATQGAQLPAATGSPTGPGSVAPTAQAAEPSPTSPLAEGTAATAGAVGSGGMPSPEATPAAPSPPSVVTAKVNEAAGLNLHDAPDTSATVIKAYKDGTVVVVLAKDSSESFLKVQAPDGLTGWMWRQRLEVQSGSLSDVPVEEEVPTPAPADTPTVLPSPTQQQQGLLVEGSH